MSAPAAPSQPAAVTERHGVSAMPRSQPRRSATPPRRHLARRHVLRALASGNGAVPVSTLPLRHIERLIGALAADGHRSQRELSKELGIALGLTNQLLQLLLGAGWVRSVRDSGGRRVTYRPTREGIDGGRHLARLHLQSCGRSYEELRAFLSTRLEAIGASTGAAHPRIVLLGDGSLVEVASLSVPSSVVLVGIVADGAPHSLGHLPAFPVSALRGDRLDGQTFDKIIIMSLDDNTVATQMLQARSVPESLIECL